MHAATYINMLEKAKFYNFRAYWTPFLMDEVEGIGRAVPVTDVTLCV